MKLDDVTREQIAAAQVAILAVAVAAVWSIWGWETAAISLLLFATADDYIRKLLKRTP